MNKRLKKRRAALAAEQAAAAAETRQIVAAGEAGPTPALPGSAPVAALPRVCLRLGKDRVLFIVAAVDCSGGMKVARQAMQAMHEAGWEVSVVSCWNDWTLGAWADWSNYTCLLPEQIAPPYDMVVSTYQGTMPMAAGVECAHRLAFIQSDEPEWLIDASAGDHFRLPGFQHVIIADHMRVFVGKYKMTIVGQVDNGVDSCTFYPDWMLERKWPRTVLMIRKSAPAWYAGECYAQEAIAELARRYDDFEVLLVGRGDAPQWPCPVRHVQTYDEHELRRCYNSVSAVVIPSLIEGCSLVGLEALACGTPLVTTRKGVDYGIDGRNVLFVPYCDGHAIAQAVSRVFDEPGLADRLAREGLRVTRERTWERMRAQWQAIIAKVMSA